MQADTVDGSTFKVRRIYCVGRNYVAHIHEMKEGDERDPPFFFQKPPNALVRDHGTVPYPPLTEDLQYEVELVVAIGKGGRNIALSDALEHVFGYAVGLDMTRRDRQREAGRKGLPWEIGKSFDYSAPCGAICPAAKVGHPATGAIRLLVDGRLRQDSDISLMIWKTPEIIANLSRQYELQPGDLIFTGTPAGVGAVVPGERLEAQVGTLPVLTVEIGPLRA
ncbi:MAG: FAA hydrolase family protein [Betaproteobacteria bacterium]|nr:MAG: FAA hydrolase family protein [Betaproteobacteria bacterium]